MSVAMIITLAVGLTGLALLAWGLYGRRTRGTPRCHRCWYDMSGHDTRSCPECGRVARTDRELLRPRRRWRTAIAAAIVLGGAGVSTWVIRVGVDTALPAAAHIALYDKRPASEKELIRRMERADLSGRDWRWIVSRHARLLDRESDPAILMRRLALLYAVENATRRPYVDRWGYDPGDDRCSVDLSEIAPAVEGLLAHADAQVWSSARLWLIQLFPSIARRRAADMLLRDIQRPRTTPRPMRHFFFDLAWLVDHPIPPVSGTSDQWDDEAVTTFLSRIGRAGSVAAARPILIEGLGSEPPVVRTCSLEILSAAGSLDETTHQRVLELLDDPSPSTRQAARQAAFAIPLDERLTKALADALSSDDEEAQRWAATFVAERGPAALRDRARLPSLLPACPVTSGLLDDLTRASKDDTGVDRMLQISISLATRDAEILIDLGMPRDEIADRLLAGLAETCPFDDDPLPGRRLVPHTTWCDHRIERTLWILTALDIERARTLAETHRLAPCPRVRLAAGSALLRFGGDVKQATGLIIEGCVETGQSQVPGTVVSDLRRRGLPLPLVTKLLDDPRPAVRLLAVRILAAAGPDHAGAAAPRLRELLEDPDFDVRIASLQALNGFILDD